MAYWLRVGATTGLVAIGLQSLVEFSLQMPGNAVFCVVLMAIALHEPPARVAHGRRGARGRSASSTVSARHDRIGDPARSSALRRSLVGHVSASGRVATHRRGRRSRRGPAAVAGARVSRRPRPSCATRWHIGAGRGDRATSSFSATCRLSSQHSRRRRSARWSSRDRRSPTRSIRSHGCGRAPTPICSSGTATCRRATRRWRAAGTPAAMP